MLDLFRIHAAFHKKLVLPTEYFSRRLSVDLL
jgi:hypothetical protein